MATHLLIFAPMALHREAWRVLLGAEPEIVVAGVAANVVEVSLPEAAGAPVTVLVDLPRPDAQTARQLRARSADCGLLFLVPTYELSEVVELLQAGATGVISRDEPAGALARSVIAAGRGEIVLPQEIASRVLGALARGERPGADLVEPLSDRERDVLGLLARGLTNKDIAQSLLLSVRTIEAHLRNIYGKLAVRSRTEAVLWAVRHGYEEKAT